MKKIILLILLQFTALMAITFNVTNNGQIILKTDTPLIQETPIMEEPLSNQVALHELGTGTTYYVDAINGLDTNNGLSESAAWQSISKVSSSAFMPGDNILFKKGQTFFTKAALKIKYAGTLENPILYGAYGSGNKPIITSVKQHPIQWISQGNNIWKSANTFDRNPERLKRNSTEILRAQDMSELGMRVPALIEWRYENNYLYLYSTTNPNSDIFSTSSLLITVDVGSIDNIVMQELDIQGGNVFAIRWLRADNTKLINMSIGAFSGEGFRYSGGTNLLIDGCTFDPAWPKSLDYTGLTGSGSKDLSPRGIQEATTMTGSATGTVIRNSIFKNWMHASISVVASGGNYNGMKIYNNYFTAEDIAYGGKNSFSYNVNNLEYYNNTHEKIYSGRTQHPSLNGNGGHYHHNLYKDMWISPLKDDVNYGFSITHNADSENIIFEDNAFIRSEPGAIKLCGGTGKVVRRNLIIDSNNPTQGYGGLVICGSSYITATTIMDNNIYDSSTENNAVWYKNRPYTMSEFNTLQYPDGDIVSGNYSSSTYSLDGIGCNFIP